jgi:hypothetical protein
MKMMIAESEFRPVMAAVYERLERLVKKKELGEEEYNLYRVLHRYRSQEGDEEPVPEFIARGDIMALLHELKELKEA